MATTAEGRGLQDWIGELIGSGAGGGCHEQMARPQNYSSSRQEDTSLQALPFELINESGGTADSTKRESLGRPMPFR